MFRLRYATIRWFLRNTQMVIGIYINYKAIKIIPSSYVFRYHLCIRQESSAETCCELINKNICLCDGNPSIFAHLRAPQTQGISQSVEQNEKPISPR
jgi:hypothetical protein